MNSKKKYIFLLFTTLLLFTSCSDKDIVSKRETSSELEENAAISKKSTSSDTIQENKLEISNESKTNVEVSSSDKNYKDALSDEEIAYLENMAINFYENDFPDELLAIKVAGDDNPWYYHYSSSDYNYIPGNILIFSVSTTYEGNDKDSFLRVIVFGRKSKDDPWEQINEGL